MEGYGSKLLFPVLIEQSVLEKNYTTRQVSLYKLKRTIPSEIYFVEKVQHNSITDLLTYVEYQQTL